LELIRTGPPVGAGGSGGFLVNEVGVTSVTLHTGADVLEQPFMPFLPMVPNRRSWAKVTAEAGPIATLVAVTSISWRRFFEIRGNWLAAR
jgi:hypothetical protein